MPPLLTGWPVKAWLAVGAVLVAWWGGALAAGAVTDNNYDDEVRDHRAKAHFYRVVAGAEEPTLPTVDNKLALDLRAAIKEGRLASFRGDTNAYGGITDALGGYDPFVSSGCQECGPLTTETLDALRQIEAGKVEALIESETPKEPSDPAGPAPLLFLAWLAVQPAVILFRGWRRRQRQPALLRDIGQQYPDEVRLVRALGEQANDPRLSAERRQEVLDVQRRLIGALSERVSAGENEMANARLDRMLSEAHEELDAIEQGNKYLYGKETH